MALFLKQSTAATIMFGPFVDKTDGVTLKTDSTTIADIDHASTGIFLSKAGAAAAIRHATVTASVADAYGMMKVTLDTTDTATVGTLDVLFAKAATYLPVFKSFEVLPANVFDSLRGTDLLDTSVVQWTGTAVATPDAAGYPKVTLKTNLKKNQALAGYEFLMTDSTNHNPATGKTVTVTRSIDGGAFAASNAGTATEVSAGIYKIDLAASDLNGTVVTLRMTATTCDDLFTTLILEPNA